MHPAFSVIFLTTLIGAGQGLFLALYTGQVYAVANLLPVQANWFYALGSGLALLLMGGGLVASFFHLGHPERGWRAVSRWSTSWLSREVIVLPLTMVWVFLYGLAHHLGFTTPLFTVADTLRVDPSLLIGLVGTVLAFLLYICTAMIYASIRFLQEWHSPLTVANYTLLGLASGFMLAAALAAHQGIHLVGFYGFWAVVATLLGLFTRSITLIRNAHSKPKVTLQSAIGVRHNTMQQKAQGAMGGSFNTREFFHHASPATLGAVKGFFLATAFILPVVLIGLAYALESQILPIVAVLVQYLGLMAERWHFFASARHPQNLYYQTIA